jgi:hypothetical protein
MAPNLPALLLLVALTCTACCVTPSVGAELPPAAGRQLRQVLGPWWPSSYYPTGAAPMPQVVYMPMAQSSNGYGYAPWPQQPTPAAAVAPVDEVAVTALRAQGTPADGGIEITTSNPIKLSNPIDLRGGNYNGNLNSALG